MVLTLYKLDASPPARSVIMVIELLEIPDVQYVDVNLLNGEHLNEQYLKMNPQHTVPMLTDNEFCIWDSHAIAAYLTTKYGKDDSLYPTEPEKRAVIDQRLHFDSGILFPALRGTAEPVFFKGEKTLNPDNLAKIKAAYELMEKFFTAPWLAGDVLTIADVCCVSSVSSMNELLSIDGTLFPKLTEWMKLCSLQDFYIKRNEPGLTMFRDLLKTKLG